MADREQPYDPYIPSGSGNAPQTGGNQRTAALQAVSIPGTPSLLWWNNLPRWLLISIGEDNSLPFFPLSGIRGMVFRLVLVEQGCDRVHRFGNENSTDIWILTANR
jgi:hypothetical protein